MLVYISCAIVTTFLSYIANKYLNKSKSDQFIGTALLLAVVLIFSFIAAFRDYDIGTDISFYGNATFNEARRYSLTELFAINGLNIEPLYLLLAKFSAIVSSKPQFQYFLIEFISVGFIIWRLCDYRDTDAIWLGVFLFNTYFFPTTLNYMRQSIALGIVFFATRYIEEKQYKKFLLLTFIAAGFHVTALFGISFLIIDAFINKENNKSKKLLHGVYIFIFFALAVLSLGKVISVIAGLGGFAAKFSRYAGQSFSGFQINPIIIRLPYLILILAFWKQFINDDKNNYYLFVIMALEVIVSELRSINVTLYRFSLFYGYYRMLSMPALISSMKTKDNKIIFAILIMIFSTLVWYYQIVIQGNESVYPYHSIIIGL